VTTHPAGADSVTFLRRRAHRCLLEARAEIRRDCAELDMDADRTCRGCCRSWGVPSVGIADLDLVTALRLLGVVRARYRSHIERLMRPGYGR
jgi:hypothetical protein